MKLYLIRHGATAANRAVPYRLQGQHSDLPLDPLGQSQAEHTARALIGVHLAAVYSSPLVRALDTARIIAQPHGLKPITLAELTEADVGRWEGKTWEEAASLDPAHHAEFMTNPGTVPYPDGESFLDVQRRAVAALGELAAEHEDDAIAVVSHNVVNRAYLASVLGLPIDRARSLRQANGGINLVTYDSQTPTLVTLNACLHLET